MWISPCDYRCIETTTRRILCAAAFFMLFPLLVQADEFHLATGKIVRGAVLSQTATEYVIQTKVGTIHLPKADIVRTVNQGTTPAEIEGDIAAKNGNLAKARAGYQQALNQAGTNTPAARRLQDKLNKLSSTSREAAQNQIITKYNQALGLLQSRRYEAAETILDDLATIISPNDPLSTSIRQIQAQIHYGKGMAALDAVKLDVARQEMEAAIQADPGFFSAYLSLGDSLLGNSATINRGIELIEQGLDVAGDRISEQQRYSYQYKLANKYFDTGDFAKAAATFAALIPARDKYPAYADALDRAVESYVRMGEENLSSDFRETIVNLNTALKLNPNNQKALFLLGRIYLDIGQIENAIVSLGRLVELNSNYEDAHHYLGRAYFQGHDNEQALKHLTIEIENHSGNYFALVDRAEVLIAMENYSGAQTDLAAAKSVDPNHWLSYYLTGLLAYEEEQYAQAQAALMEALERKRTAVPVHLLMSKVITAQNQPDGARQWLEQVVNQLTGVENLSYRYKVYLADALTQLGEISVEANSPRQAENYLKSALETLPNHTAAMVAMADTKLLLAADAYVSASRDQLYKDAAALYLKAIKTDPANAEYYLKLATFHHRYQVDHDQALKNYNLYVDYGGTDPRVNTWLVEVGGTARPEITPISTVAATTTMGTTATMTSGPLGMTMAATTATGMMAPAPGSVVLPVDAIMAENPTTAIVGMTTTTGVQPPSIPVVPGVQP